MRNESRAPLIIAAMPTELRHALEASEQAHREVIGPWIRWWSVLDGHPANFLLSGIGMVNAGAALSRALCDLNPSVVLNFGCAGAHQASMHPGDVVIGTRYVHHRAVTILPTGQERFGGTPVRPEDPAHFVDGFEADPTLLTAARSASLDWHPSPWPERPDVAPAIHAGPLTSADAWTQATDLIERIHEQHGTFCEDMEAAALAQVCWMHDLPFLAVKDISNNEFHSATDYGVTGGPTLESVANEVGRRAFELVRRVLRERAEPS